MPVSVDPGAAKRQAIGRRGEALARRYLESRGCTVVGENVRLGKKEVDLIVRDGRDLVFVEVKTRSGVDFGTPEEAVTRRKLQLLERAMALYLRQHRDERRVRLDVVAIVWPGPDRRPTLRHYRAVGDGGTLAFL